MPGEELSQIVTYLSISEQPGLARHLDPYPVHAAALTVEGSHKAGRMWRLSVALPRPGLAVMALPTDGKES